MYNLFSHYRKQYEGTSKKYFNQKFNNYILLLILYGPAILFASQQK